MKQWDICLHPFELERPHPVVIVSSDERSDNSDLPSIHGLICTSIRLERFPQRLGKRHRTIVLAACDLRTIGVPFPA